MNYKEGKNGHCFIDQRTFSDSLFLILCLFISRQALGVWGEGRRIRARGKELAIPSGAQGFLMALCSGVIPGICRRLSGVRIQTCARLTPNLQCNALASDSLPPLLFGFRTYSWLCHQGSFLAGSESYGVSRIKPLPVCKAST